MRFDAYVRCSNADFTTGIGVTYEEEPLTIRNDRLWPLLNVKPMKTDTKVQAGHRLLPTMYVTILTFHSMNTVLMTFPLRCLWRLG
jgi:hypothetical protein